MGFSPGDFTDRFTRAVYHFEGKDGRRIVLWDENESKHILDLDYDQAIQAYKHLGLLLLMAGMEE